MQHSYLIRSWPNDKPELVQLIEQFQIPTLLIHKDMPYHIHSRGGGGTGDPDPPPPE